MRWMPVLAAAALLPLTVALADVYAYLMTQTPKRNQVTRSAGTTVPSAPSAQGSPP